MWNTLTPQQQVFLMQVLQRQGSAATMPSGGMPMQQPTGVGMMPGAAQMAPGLALQTGQQAAMPGQAPMAQAGLPTGLGNPLMTGGNSAVNPQQQAAMQQYMAMLQSPQGWGAGANGNVPVWQLLMGRSPWYGQGTAVP